MYEKYYPYTKKKSYKKYTTNPQKIIKNSDQLSLVSNIYVCKIWENRHNDDSCL